MNYLKGDLVEVKLDNIYDPFLARVVGTGNERIVVLVLWSLAKNDELPLYKRRQASPRDPLKIPYESPLNGQVYHYDLAPFRGRSDDLVSA